MTIFSGERSLNIKATHISFVFFLLCLLGCQTDAEVEKPKSPAKAHAPSMPKSALKNKAEVKQIIALNHSLCILSNEGAVHCAQIEENGPLNWQAFRQVDLTGIKAKHIYGSSGDTNYFDTGYHGCALLENNQIRCWGNITSDTVINANEIFDFTKLPTDDTAQGQKPATQNQAVKSHLIKSYSVKQEHLQKIGEIKKLLTSHGVLCAINKKNQLYCPHKHLSFLNGSEVQHGVFGEILSCIQSLDGELECYDMRGSADKSPILLNLDGESWPMAFGFRYIYAGGIAMVSKEGAAMYWQGAVPEWNKFPGIYGIENTQVPLGPKQKAEAVYLSETSVCLKLSDGSANCWGQVVEGKWNPLKPPGKNINFGDGKQILDIALGANYHCFLLNNNSIDCFKF